MPSDRPTRADTHTFSRIQRVVLGLMTGLVCLTFLTANLQALLWQSSDWLVSTVLPAVVVDLTNDERNANIVPTLVRNPVLDAAARRKAEHMATEEYFSHFSPDGISPWHWFREAGYVYAHAGENLAIHFTDSAEVVDAWMKSPTHRDNIVNGQYTEIGVGTARGSFEGYDTVYVVQLFGTPAVPPPATEVVAVAAAPEPLPTPQAAASVPPPSVSGAQNTTVPTQPEPAAPTAVAADSTTASATTPPVDIIAEEPAQPEHTNPSPEDVVIVTRSLVSTSSGLAIASVNQPHATHAGATVASIATRPHQVLQFMYVAVATLTLVLLAWSIMHQARRLHFRQVAYSIGLLVAMGGLWYVHQALTAGAVIV